MSEQEPVNNAADQAALALIDQLNKSIYDERINSREVIEALGKTGSVHATKTLAFVAEKWRNVRPAAAKAAIKALGEIGQDHRQ